MEKLFMFKYEVEYADYPYDGEDNYVFAIAATDTEAVQAITTHCEQRKLRLHHERGCRLVSKKEIVKGLVMIS